MKESIFKSTIRALFVSFAVLIGLILAAVVTILCVGAISNNVNLPDKGTLTVSADVHGNRKLLSSSSPVILRIDINGIIGDMDLNEKKISNLLYDSREGVLSGNRVKGILLHINTPGGLATDSSAIYQLLMDYKQKYQVPIYAYVDGMCASGGMYIACAADQIYATSDSVIGSVGVRLGPTFNVSQTMDKIGISALTLTEGKNKDALNPFRPWKEGEDTFIKNILAKEYEQFVGVVTTARNRLSKEKLINDYGAQVYIASEAMEYGYIDKANTQYNDCLAALVQAAGIPEGKEYQVLLAAPSQSVLEELAKNKNGLLRGRIEHVFPIAPGINSDMSGKLLFLHTLTN